MHSFQFPDYRDAKVIANLFPPKMLPFQPKNFYVILEGFDNDNAIINVRVYIATSDWETF